MKTFLNNILLLCAVMMAGATFTACSSSSDDDLVSEQSATGAQTYTLTIKAGMAADATRALVLKESPSGDELDAQWAEGDVVYVYKQKSDYGYYSRMTTRSILAQYTFAGTLKAAAISQDGHECTLTGALTGELQAGDVLRLLTPSDFPIDYRDQKGTLDDIAANFDYCQAAITVESVNGSQVNVTDMSSQTPTNVAIFHNGSAIVRFTLVDENNQPLSASSLTINAGIEWPDEGGFDIVTQYMDPMSGMNSMGELTISLGNSPSSTVWAALSMESYGTVLGARQTRAVIQEPTDCVIMLKATVGSDVYVFESEVESFLAGQFYEITVHMHKATPLDAVTSNDLGRVIGADGNLYDNVAAATAAQTTAEAMIAYVGRNWGFFRHGLAISLTDVYEYNVDYSQAIGAIVIPQWNQAHAVQDLKWRLPSEEDWQYMLWNYYASEPQPTDISGFNSLLTNAGGAPLVTDGYYWTSDEDDENDANALCVYQDDTNAAGFSAVSKNFYAKVRACLPF